MGHHSKQNMQRPAGRARPADRAPGRRRRQLDLPVRRGLELRRGRRRRAVRPGHPAQHGRHRDRLLQRPAARRGARGRPVRRGPAGPGLRVRALHRPERRGGQRHARRAARGPPARAGPDQGRAWPATCATSRSGPPPGETVLGKDVDYNGQPAGYTEDPSEIITYVDAHDNETLFDSLALKLPRGTSMADRVRMNTLSLSTMALSQGVVLWHAGTDLLRSKSWTATPTTPATGSTGSTGPARRAPSARDCRRRPTTTTSGTTCGRCWRTRR